MHGPFVEPKHNEKLFLCVDDGTFSSTCCQLSLTGMAIFRFSVLPALSLHEGIIHCEIVEGSFCTETFFRFIEGLLDNMQPYPASNSVIIMDNCRIHKHPEILQLIQSRYG
jgi:hypothetical protein